MSSTFASLPPDLYQTLPHSPNMFDSLTTTNKILSCSVPCLLLGFHPWHHISFACTSFLPPHLEILIGCSNIASSHLPLTFQIFVSLLLQGYKPKLPDKLDGILASYRVIPSWIQRTVWKAPRLKFKNWKKPSWILGWVSEILKFIQRGHRQLIFERDSGFWPKDCWKIQGIANWLGMGRSSRGVKKTSAVSLTAANTICLTQHPLRKRWQSQRNLQTWQVGQRVVNRGTTLSLTQVSLRKHLLCSEAPLKPGNGCLSCDGFSFEFWNSRTTA